MKLFSLFRKRRDAQKFPSKKLKKVVNNAIKFLDKSPLYNLPIKSKFDGCGVYALFYSGVFYGSYSSNPIYIGKAVPKGWRNGRASKERKSFKLWNRIKEHVNSISQAENLKLEDFTCKYVILDFDLIVPVEAKMIRVYQPMWNCIVDGFGCHHPGKTRYSQRQTDWDVIHPGRKWANNMTGEGATFVQIMGRVFKFIGERK